MRRAFALSVTLAVGCGGGGSESRPDAPDLVDTASDPCRLAGPPRALGNVRGLSAELSGLAASRVNDGVLWTHADSGGVATIFAIDTTAASLGELHVTGVTPIDWEDIATGPCAAGQCIFIADTGDNDLERASVAIYEVTEPATAMTADVTAIKRDITYPDEPHNVEALVVDPRDGALYGITKVTAARAKLYQLASPTATALGELPMFPGADVRVTAADFAVDDECGARLLVRTRSALFLFAGARDVAMSALIATTPVMMPVANEPQGEAVAWRRDGRAYFTVSEGTDPPLWIVR
jgi:hypothetical protein